MDVVVVGAGEVGLYLAQILSGEGHRVSLVDLDPEKIRRVRESLDVQALEGDGCLPEVLNDAGAGHADLFVAVSDDDRVNMLSCLMARKLGAAKVVLRVHDTRGLIGYHYFLKGAIGYDVVLSTDELAADEVLATVREQHALEVESFADGRVQLRRLRIREASELTQGSLADLELPGGLLVAAISRGERFFVPGGEDRLEVGDQVYLIGKAPDLDQFEVLSGARKLGRRSVVIMGGGSIGMRIATRLENVPGISVRLFERDPDHARAIAQHFGKNVMVLVGDATDLDLLDEERIGGDTNIFIAATGRDEDNMMACQLASSLGVERTVALVNKPSYRKLYSLLGIDNAISPRILCANRILRFVRAGSVRSIAVVAEGRGEVLEIEAHFRGGKKERRVKELGLPKGVVIGAVVQGEEVTIPGGDTVIEDGDRLILFALPSVVDEIGRVFRPADEA